MHSQMTWYILRLSDVLGMVPFSSLYKVTVWADKFPQKKKKSIQYSYVLNHPRVVESIKYQKNHLEDVEGLPLSVLCSDQGGDH